MAYDVDSMKTMHSPKDEPDICFEYMRLNRAVKQLVTSSKCLNYRPRQIIEQTLLSTSC